MWFRIAQFILRNRILILISLAGITGVFGYFAATNVEVDTSFATILPESDPVRKDHEQLKELFGEDGNVVVIGVEGVDLFELENFKKWYSLGLDMQKIEGIDSVFSVAHMYELVALDGEKKFILEKICKKLPSTQEEVDQIKERVLSQEFYKNLLFKDSSSLSLMMITVDGKKFNSLARGSMIADIYEQSQEYKKSFSNLRYSGLPYIREVVAVGVKKEIRLTILLAALVTGIILFFFFRSIVVVLSCLLVVGVGVVWSFGTIGMLDIRLSMLLALLPPLMIVIGIPNCTYLLNKYHAEYMHHGNKAKALSRVIQKVGNATFLTNVTTALGFGAFMFTNSIKMQEFGIVAFINILAIFIISICLIPIIFSYLKPPSQKHTKHLQKKWVEYTVDQLVAWVTHKRTAVYIITILVVLLSGFGMSRMITTGNISGDLPQGNPILEDLHYFEREFGGVMPFEVVVDAKVENGAIDADLLKRIERAQRQVESYKLEGNRIFSRSLSIADAIKYAHQALEGGDPSYYDLEMSGREKIKLKKYTKNSSRGEAVGNTFLDSTGRFTRISFQIADVGSHEMELVTEKVRAIIDTILNPSIDSLKYYRKALSSASGDDQLQLVKRFFASQSVEQACGDVKWKMEERMIALDSSYSDLVSDSGFIFSLANTPQFQSEITDLIDSKMYKFSLTGTAVVFTRGTTYLVRNLMISLALAVLMIAFLMAILFGSIRMVLVSLLPNFIPLLTTAGIMGFAGIPIKPSTILIFSVAFGISIDDTIHYLAKYRQELKTRSWNIRDSVLRSLKETGVSMIYTSIVLFFGFSVFSTSEFGGTKALGVLVSITLLVAMLANLVVLPSLLLSLDKVITNKAFKEPLLEIIDEEEDIELEELEVQKNIES